MNVEIFLILFDKCHWRICRAMQHKLLMTKFELQVSCGMYPGTCLYLIKMQKNKKLLSSDGLI